MKVKDFISNSEKFLRNNGIGESRLNSEYIMSEVLNIGRTDIFLHGDRNLTASEIRKAEKYLDLKVRGYPLSWIFGRHNFNGVELSISAGVFVPRPETEELAEMALKASVEKGGKLRALDFCSGSGCIAVFLALKNPLLSVFAVEKFAKAFSCILINAAKYGLKNLKTARSSRMDVFGGRFDIIVSNPPYIPSAVIENLDVEVKMEPIAALDGGRDGLDMVRVIERHARKMLAPGGLLFLEFGDGQAEAVRDIFCGWELFLVIKDMSGKDRFIKAGGPPNGQPDDKRRQHCQRGSAR